MYKEFLKGEKYTSKELLNLAIKKFGSVSLRTIQRDLKLLQQCVPELESKKVMYETRWHIPAHLRYNKGLNLKSNELLSFYILKAYLKTFEGTVIFEDAQNLAEKLEEHAPGDAFSDASFFWDQNAGQFDYTQYDDILRKVLSYLNNKKWATVSYKSIVYNEEKTYDVQFCKLFSYGGSIYASVYIPKHENFIALSLQGIQDITDAKRSYSKAPEFEFDKFTKTRFGVYTANINDVILRVDKGFVQYFKNRRWHQSQTLRWDDNGDLIIRLKVPIVPDFIAWILSWHEVMKVEHPPKLKRIVKEKLMNALKNYEEEFQEPVLDKI
jgi:predicted DNA-binding transcriptional regulator YafY